MTVSPKPDYGRLRTNLELIGQRPPTALFEVGLPAAEKLYQSAYHDSLTGLLNRDGFERQLGDWQAAQPSGDTPIAIAYIDVNNFKAVNDVYGHDKGDEVLQFMAGRLTAILREDDIIGRLGGDELVIALPIRTPESISHEEVAAALDNLINGSLEQAKTELNQKLGGSDNYLTGLSFAIGVEVYEARDLKRDLSELLKLPDDRMYDDKNGAHVAI